MSFLNIKFPLSNYKFAFIQLAKSDLPLFGTLQINFMRSYQQAYILSTIFYVSIPKRVPNVKGSNRETVKSRTYMEENIVLQGRAVASLRYDVWTLL